MPLDPQAQMVMNQIAALGFPPTHTLSPAEARRYSKARPRAPGPEVAKVEDRCISLPDREITVRIYTPEGKGPFPVLVWFHGGGWVIGDLDTADGTARYLSVGADCVVVSVDYRLAPETKFPGPLEDCFEATRWVAQNAASLNTDISKIAVGGDSAGGNLAAGVALMARDRGGPPLVFQLLVYPVIDRNFGTSSYQHNADGYQLTRASMMWYWDRYLRGEADAANPYAAPLQSKDLVGLPAALVITAEFDPLRDEGEAYAQHLRDASVRTEYTRYDGMIHGFFGMSAVLDKGKQAISQASAALRAAFAMQRGDRIRTFVRVYTGDDGQSHIEEVTPPFQPFLDTEGAHGEGTPLEAATGITFRISPPGYFLNWHCAPRRQYTITLSGEVEVEVGDGNVRRLGPGDILVAEDLTGQGHTTRVVSREPRFYVVVPLAD